MVPTYLGICGLGSGTYHRLPSNLASPIADVRQSEEERLRPLLRGSAFPGVCPKRDTN